MTERTGAQSMSEPIVIAMAFDTLYAPHAASTIASIVRHASIEALRFLILQADIDEETRRRVEAVAPRAAFTWIDVAEHMFPELAERGHINRTTLFRLGLEKLAPDAVTRAIYLDADLIVCRDIAELWRADLGDAPLGAAPDSWVDSAAFAKTWSLSPEHAYFNAGVLLIDLEAGRREGLFSAALAFQAEHGEALAYNDQDALNYIYWGRWRALDPAWNTQTTTIMTDLDAKVLSRRRPGIVHFTTDLKPWLHEKWHPWAWLYWDNLARTSFLDEICARHDCSPLQRFRLWLRWQRWRPRPALGQAH